MKRILSLMLALLVLAFSSSAVLADDINKGDLSLIDVTLAQPTQLMLMMPEKMILKT